MLWICKHFFSFLIKYPLFRAKWHIQTGVDAGKQGRQVGRQGRHQSFCNNGKPFYTKCNKLGGGRNGPRSQCDIDCPLIGQSMCQISGYRVETTDSCYRLSRGSTRALFLPWLSQCLSGTHRIEYIFMSRCTKCVEWMRWPYACMHA